MPGNTSYAKGLKNFWGFLPKVPINQVWYVPPIIPVLRKLRQEDHDFETSLGYKDPVSKKRGSGG
jgi:hypothetical protein